MATLTVELSEEDAQKFKKAAQQAGISVEDAAVRAIKSFSVSAEDVIVGPDDESLQRDAEELLKENAELYRRLA